MSVATLTKNGRAKGKVNVGKTGEATERPKVVKGVGQMILISPQMAREWLACEPATDIKQRPVDKYKVQAIARTHAKNGEYDDRDPIRRSPSGFVLEGQHRLRAIASGTVSKYYLVLENEPESKFKFMGGSKTRTATDVLAMDGHLNYTMLAATLHNLYRFYETESLAEIARSSDKRLQPYHYPGLVDRFKSVENSIKYGNTHQVTFLARSSIATLHYIFNQLDPETANTFMAGLTTGAQLEAGSPVHVLREKLILIRAHQKERRLHQQVGKTEKFAIVIKAWNATKAGSTIKAKDLKLGRKEKFPMPL